MIAGKLIEINVTSPTLVQELKRFGGADLPKAFWDRVEQMVTMIHRTNAPHLVRGP